MGIQMLSTLNQYIKTLRMQTQWDLKREKEDLTSRGKTLEEWLSDTSGASRKEARDSRGGDSKLQTLQMKVYNGRALTQKEKEYLKEHDPETYEKARSLERQKKAYESALKRCRTKEEVQRLKLAHLGTSLSVVNAVKHNPNIGKDKKLEILMMENGKLANIEKATRDFVRRGEYERLPDEQESLTEGALGLKRPLELLLRPALERLEQAQGTQRPEAFANPWREQAEQEARETRRPSRTRKRLETRA